MKTDDDPWGKRTETYGKESAAPGKGIPGSKTWAWLTAARSAGNCRRKGQPGAPGQEAKDRKPLCVKVL